MKIALPRSISRRAPLFVWTFVLVIIALGFVSVWWQLDHATSFQLQQARRVDPVTARVYNQAAIVLNELSAASLKIAGAIVAAAVLVEAFAIFALVVDDEAESRRVSETGPQLGVLVSVLDNASHALGEIRGRYDATTEELSRAEAIVALSRDQVDSVRKMMAGEIRRQGRSGWWIGAIGLAIGIVSLGIAIAVVI
jgi:hypothetical protein